MQTFNLLFDTGKLEVFASPELDSITGAATTGYYWRDPGSPQGYGPFVSLLTCMQHYAWLVKQAKGTGHLSLVKKDGEIIRVDFQKKCIVDQ